MEMKIKIDFAEFGCESSFPCPECGELISSEDKSGRAYSISHIRLEEGTIQDLLIRCNYGSSIMLYRPVDPPEDFKPLVDDCELEDPDYDLERQAQTMTKKVEIYVPTIFRTSVHY